MVKSEASKVPEKDRIDIDCDCDKEEENLRKFLPNSGKKTIILNNPTTAEDSIVIPKLFLPTHRIRTKVPSLALVIFIVIKNTRPSEKFSDLRLIVPSRKKE